jgi:biopolymer transport protein ExbB
MAPFYARRLSVLILLVTLCNSFTSSAVVAHAETDDGTTIAAEQMAPEGFFDIIFSGGLTGFLIVMLLLALSVGMVALIVEHLLSIRPAVLMPPGLAENVQRQLLAGDAGGADMACRAHPSFLAFVLQAGIAEVDGGWSAVEKSMEDATAEQSARLFRKIEYLSVIANIAPMVGLLGTVFGMIFAFQEVASSQGSARAADLATGIYQALVTTVGGLLVAIPALAAFAVFRNRVDQLVAESAYMAQHIFAPLKRRRNQRRQAGGSGLAPTPPPTTSES